MARKKLNVLIAASECAPLVKVGGIADVVGSLPQALAKQHIDARVLLPFYKVIDTQKFPTKLIKKDISVRANNKDEKVAMYETKSNGTTVYLLENKSYISNGDVYNPPNLNKHPAAQQERFAFFSLAIIACLPHLPVRPDILHLNDWHTGLVPRLLQQSNMPNKPKTIFTIHNLAYQGMWSATEACNFLHIDTPQALQSDIRNNELNELLSAVHNADQLTTVSPNYAKEILTKQFGQGLEKDLRKRKNNLTGILNGLDLKRFNPETDPDIAQQYSEKTIEQKIHNKTALQLEFGLPQEQNVPLLGVVTRLANQKGVDLIAAIIPRIVKLGAQLVILGTGDPDLEQALRDATKKFPKQVYAHIDFDAALAQQIYAAADMFLIPSRFEPCGLTQMIAMRYGTVPIVRATGGLKDTVMMYRKKGGAVTGNGFVFTKQTHKALYAIIKKAVRLYTADRTAWHDLQLNAMRSDFSWDASAKVYAQLYQKLT